MTRNTALGTFDHYGDACEFLHEHAREIKRLGMAHRYGVRLSPVTVGKRRRWRVWLVDRVSESARAS
jgi:hypothetical protein